MDVIAESPVRAFFDQVEALEPSSSRNLQSIGDLLVAFARDTEFWQHHVDALGERSGARPVHTPDRGPRLQLVHRLDGQMGAIHSHKVWVAIAPLSGTETHRRYALAGSGEPAIAETRELNPGDFATLVPPEDIHDHGHVAGHGEAAYVLILTGDNQLAFQREQYATASSAVRLLEPGDPGSWIAR